MRTRQSSRRRFIALVLFCLYANCIAAIILASHPHARAASTVAIQLLPCHCERSEAIQLIKLPYLTGSPRRETERSSR